LTLQWHQVDLRAGIVRLDPGTTKNREGRSFPFSMLPELRELLEEQRAATTILERQTSRIVPWVFHRGGAPSGSIVVPGSPRAARRLSWPHHGKARPKADAVWLIRSWPARTS
jgi:integrase